MAGEIVEYATLDYKDGSVRRFTRARGRKIFKEIGVPLQFSRQSLKNVATRCHYIQGVTFQKASEVEAGGES